MTFREALKMLKSYRRQMSFVMTLSVVISIISAVTPFVSRNMIDKGLLQGNVNLVIYLVLLMILLQLCGQCIEYIQRRAEINITNDLGKKMKAEAFEHGLKLKPHYFKEQGFYKTISDAIYDISVILQITNSNLLALFVIICKCVGAMAGLVALDWQLSLFVAAIIPVKLWLNTIMRKRAEKHSEHLMDDNKGFNSWFTNILSGIIDIKLWNLERKMTDEYAGHVQLINESSKKLSLLDAKNNLLVVGIEFSLMNALYIVGAVLIARNRLTFGGLIAFITFASYVLNPMSIIMDLRLILKRITPSVEGLKRFYELEEEDYTKSLSANKHISTIEFKNVSVSFEGREILKNLCLKVNRGDKIAIIGENGSGKTTIINLLLRLCEPTGGVILLDGVPITEYGIEEYRRMFSVVSQDIHLFNGTAMDNIALDGKSGCSDSIDKTLFCSEFIENWEQRYETQVGNEGMKLSGGERQKLALLRALHRKTDILVLDEPTSNYDKESDGEFNRFIRENTDYGFYFIVTHRKGTLSGMDKVLMLENGNIRCEYGL